MEVDAKGWRTDLYPTSFQARFHALEGCILTMRLTRHYRLIHHKTQRQGFCPMPRENPRDPALARTLA